VAEIPLPGGSVSAVVRVGDTVRRRPAARAGFVHGLLAFFERAGWDGAPRFLGFDGQGREILSFVDGRGGIVDVIMWWQDRCWRGIRAGAAAGDPAMVRLRTNLDGMRATLEKMKAVAERG